MNERSTCVGNLKTESSHGKLASYVRKYGPIDGPIIYRTLQKQAAQASVKARYRKKLKNAGLI